MTLFDCVIDVDFYRGDTLVFSLKCPTEGPKPDITVSTNQVTGSICFQTRVTIGNLQKKQEDIMQWTRMVVTMGYSSSNYRATLDCSLFSAWIASPAPDSSTVFSGLCVGKVGGFFDAHPMIIHFTTDEITVLQLIQAVIDVTTSSSLVVDMRDIQGDPILTRVIQSPVKTVQADNALQLFSWLDDRLYSLTKDVRVFVHNNTVKIEHTVTSNSVQEKLLLADNSRAISIDYVTDVQFTAALLTVTGPWNPSITPGSIIRLPTKYYINESIPNSEMLGLLDKDQLYTVILGSYTVSTLGESSMTLKAVSRKYAEGNPTPYELAQNISQFTSGTSLADIAKSLTSSVIKTASEVFVPGRYLTKADVTTLYARCAITSPAYELVSRNTDYIALLEQKYGTDPVFTLTAEQAQTTNQAAAAAGYSLHVAEGYSVYPKQLWPAVYAVCYNSQPLWGTKCISDAKIWTIQKHVSDCFFPSVFNPTAAATQKAFWLGAIPYLNKYKADKEAAIVMAFKS